jgi:hypothetical protein
MYKINIYLNLLDKSKFFDKHPKPMIRYSCFFSSLTFAQILQNKMLIDEIS